MGESVDQTNDVRTNGAGSASAGARNAVADSLRPRLRHDTVYADTGQGAFVRHSDDGFLLTGKSAYEWIATLAPHLDGQHTLSELCEGLSSDRRTMVVDMVGTLLDRDFVRDAAAPRPAEGSSFDRQLNFIAHYKDDEQTRLDRFRDARILLAGSSEVLKSTATNLLRNGARNVLLAPGTTGSGPLVASINEQMRDENAADGGPVFATVEEHDNVGTGDREIDAVVVVADGSAGTFLLEAVKNCVGDGPIVLPVTVVDGDVVLGPMTRPDAAPCWICAMLRLETTVEVPALSEVWRSASLPDTSRGFPVLPQAAARMVGSEVAFELFRFFTGCMDAETDASVLIQNPQTLETTPESLLPHPHCSRCQGLDSAASSKRSRRAGVVNRSELENDDLGFERQFALVGEHLGPVLEYRDEPIVQSPVKVARVRLATAGAPGSGPREITAFHVRSLVDARARLIDRAVLSYLDAIGSPTSTAHSGEVVALDGGRMVPPESLSTWLGGDRGIGEHNLWEPADSMLTGMTKFVPAACVHPFHPLNAANMFERTSAGAGCGATPDDARHAGLLSAVAHLGVREVSRGAGATSLRFGGLADDSEIAFLLRAIGHYGLRAEAMVIHAAGKIPVVIAWLDGADLDSIWTLAAGFSTQEAAVEALTDLVGTIQLREVGEESPYLGNPMAADFDPRTLRVVDSCELSETAAVLGNDSDVIESVRAAGGDALIVETTTRDLLSSGHFHTAKVLLTD